MNTCFLFTQYLNDTGCFCLILSADGLLLETPQQLEFKEIKRLQADCQTVLVESCSQITLISLELPWLAENKARAAIPYALEDKLAQPTEDLHFAFDKLRYHNNHYLITVISKSRMRYLMEQMNQHHIDFDKITVDWFALEEGELCVSDSHLLVNQSHFKGCLSGSLALNYIKQHSTQTPLLFQNNNLLIDSSIEPVDGPSYVWFARSLLKTKPLNLCQGEMRHETGAHWIKKSTLLISVLGIAWLCSILVVNAWMVHSLNQKNHAVEEEIALVYRQFFPGAKQVISPKFRINQLINTNQEKNQTQFWFLINQLAKHIKNTPITIEQIRYQSKILFVTLQSPDFATLETLENNLRQAQFKVHQTEASTHEQHVMATLELS